jgi:hypothetical protein
MIRSTGRFYDLTGAPPAQFRFSTTWDTIRDPHTLVVECSHRRMMNDFSFGVCITRVYKFYNMCISS